MKKIIKHYPMTDRLIVIRGYLHNLFNNFKYSLNVLKQNSLRVSTLQYTRIPCSTFSHYLHTIVPSILPSYGTAGSMIPRYLFCLFLCTAAPSAGFSIYIFINTTVTFIGTSGHSVQMS